MNKAILNTEIQSFINNNLDSNITSILLKGTSFSSLDTKEIIEQIEAKKKCENKLATWFQTKNIYYPNKLNIEQTSSEVTAHYKSKLIKGNSLIDITGGFGVDSLFFSKYFEKIVHCELDKHLSDIVKHNYSQLGVINIETQNIDGIQFLRENNKPVDWIYADPSRRHDRKGKVFFLNDCLPNIPEQLDTIFNYTKNVMIKTSPLLDLTIGINELNHVKSIHIVAINNEVKEILWILEKNFLDEIFVKTVNIFKEDFIAFDFLLNDEKKHRSEYSLPLTFLYEPNAAVLKAGAFNIITKQLQVFKLHTNSHLYTSHKLIDFPGRRFKIENILPYHIKTIKQANLKKANITTRNFPESVQQLRKKLNIKDGGEKYLFFTTDKDDRRIVIITSKLF
ncbi:class I SAM-dependent methyltransferase [Gaetbulibacter aquiaggeris]|uniref:Class I SAM-dependent methyltransferase n=1 Tax=Gaetbulibacter aquiaggeris TaxID=1735373 RepID=A0ABW7MRW4_9FLAO